MPKRNAETVDIPSRHGSDMTRSRQIARSIRRTVRGDPEPTPARWRALGQALMHGDPLMDDVVAWLYDDTTPSARREKRALLQTAIARGMDTVPGAPPALQALCDHVRERPAWVDDDLLEHGARVCHRTGQPGLHVLRDVALMLGYQAAGINQTLIATGSLERGAQRRLAETTAWWIDCTSASGMARSGAGFKNTLQVRLIHALIRRNVQNKPNWRTDIWGIPVNQADMLATQLGFSVIFLLGTRVLGVPLSKADGRAVMHLWRYIGWLMGVAECWLPKDEQDGRRLLYHVLLSQAPPDASSAQLGKALMNEPLDRPYPDFAWLRGQYIRARHVSITRLFVDRQGMRDLGLPDWVLPWYPAMRAPATLAYHAGARFLPGGRKRAERAGRQAQIAQLQALFGDRVPAIHRPALG